MSKSQVRQADRKPGQLKSQRLFPRGAYLVSAAAGRLEEQLEQQRLVAVAGCPRPRFSCVAGVEVGVTSCAGFTFYKMCQTVDPSLVLKLFWRVFLLTTSFGRMSGYHSGRGRCWLSQPASLLSGHQSARPPGRGNGSRSRAQKRKIGHNLSGKC